MHRFLSFIAVSCDLHFLRKRFPVVGDCIVPEAGIAAVCATVAQHKRQFIIDVCDGRHRQAERLIAEKALMHPGLGATEVLNRVYQDMLALTAEERAAACATPVTGVRRSAVSGSSA